MSGLNLFAKLVKVDEEQRLIYGRAVDETPDRSGEVFDYKTSKPHFQKWSDETQEASDGKSLGNLRAMHGKVAAGKLTDISFDDSAKTINVVAKVVDDQEWRKVLEGIYTGFSIGGAYANKWDDPSIKKSDGKAAKRYTANPSELSLVDRPCIPSAKFFDIQKADGMTEQREFKSVLSDADIEIAARALAKDSGFDPDSIDTTDGGTEPLWKSYVEQAAEQWLDLPEDVTKREFTEKQRENLAAKGKAMPDGSFPINNATDLANAIKDSGRAKDPAAAKAHIIERAKALKLTASLPADWEGSTAEKLAEGDQIDYQVEGTDDEVAKLAAVMRDEKLNMAAVLSFVQIGTDLAKVDADKTVILKFETDGKLKKGMYLVAQVAQLVAQLQSIRESIVNEETRESDTESVLPQKSLDLLGTATDLLQAMVIEESAEALGDTDDVDGPMAPIMAMAHFGDLKKFGARNSAMDSAAIQKMHDLANSLGAACGNKEAAHSSEGLAKVDVESIVEGMLAKMRSDNGVVLAKLESANTELLAKVAKLEAQPAPSRAVLRVVHKGHDIETDDGPGAQLVLDKAGGVNEVASLIKMMHQHGGVSMGLRPDGTSIL